MTAELWAQLVGGVGFFILVSGTLWGIWWRIEGRVDKAKTEVSTVASAAAAQQAARRAAGARPQLGIAEALRLVRQGAALTPEPRRPLQQAYG